MVKRKAQRGTYAGSEFWGCSDFPRCRGIVRGVQPADGSDDDALADKVGVAAEEAADSDSSDKPGGLLSKVAKTIDKVERWYLESDEPDATGRWDDAHRLKVLRYVYRRDEGRCGLCAGEMKRERKGMQIEHIVPKVFAVFDVRKGGKAEPGTRWKSRLHKLDNLQIAHTYCNKRKGNTPETKKWRHPDMPQLTVADAEDGQTFVLPWKPPRSSG